MVKNTIIWILALGFIAAITGMTLSVMGIWHPYSVTAPSFNYVEGVWTTDDFQHRLDYMQWHTDRAKECFEKECWESGIALIQDAIEAIPETTGDPEMNKHFRSLGRQLRAIIVDTRRSLEKESNQ